MRTGLAAVVAAVTCALTAVLAAPAQAAAYRYWTYWQSAPGLSAWVFSSHGAGTSVPADGAVEGWRFAISTENASGDSAPRTSADFDSVCAGVAFEPGAKRVAVVLDPGPAAIAPDGEQPFLALAQCVVADEEATGYDIVRSVVDVRTEDGFVCALGGYPARECAPILDEAQVAALAPTAGDVDGTAAGEDSDAAGQDSGAAGQDSGAAAQDSGASGAQSEEAGQESSTSTFLVVSILILAALAFFQLRRRRT